MKRLAIFVALVFPVVPGAAQDAASGKAATAGGATVSAISLRATPEAKKAFDRGLESMSKGRAADAQSDFEKAVKLYPLYADAWLNLGKVRLQRKATGPAAEAFQKAVDADDKLVEAQFNLGLLEVAKNQWPEAAEHLDAAVRLDPVRFPDAWYNDAVVHYNLRNYDGAEKSAREFIKLDPQRKNHQVDFLLGAILAGKDDYSGAADELRIYLKAAPKGPDAAKAKNLLDQIEKLQAPNH